jgi:hypothetical protein
VVLALRVWQERIGGVLMTTSELWAKAESEKRWEGETIPQNAKPFVAADNAGFEQGILHVLSLLESEQAVEAVCAVIDPNALEVDMYPEPKATARTAWDATSRRRRADAEVPDDHE